MIPIFIFLLMTFGQININGREVMLPIDNRPNDAADCRHSLDKADISQFFDMRLFDFFKWKDNVISH
jgi:hypothetical protein